jgi:N-acetylglucosaminyldiphosphoundecaprenol N-acetyl-beta-D-mannosaminyltransferase
MSNLLGYKILSKPLESIDFNKSKVINTINPHSFCIAEKDIEFKKALLASDVLLPDGIGIVWADRVLNKNKIKKIAGYDLFEFLMKKANEKEQKVFFLGASEDTLKKISKKAHNEYPNVKVFYFSPPYKPYFSIEETQLMIDQVNTIKPDILFVGMSAPKQEKWVFLNQDRLSVKNICSIGAVFDFYSGNIKRSSPFWINLGLEWLPRLLKEPKRLFYRNFVSTPKFIYIVLYNKFFRNI